MQNFFTKKKKRIFSKKKFSSRKTTIKFQENKLPSRASGTIDSLVSQPKFIEIVLKLIDSRLNYKDNTVWEISMIIIMALIAVFVLHTMPTEAKSFKLFPSFKINPVSNKINPKAYSGLIVMVKGKNKFYSSMAPKIISKNGRSVFGNAPISHSQFNYLIREGIATFTDNLRIARHRSGTQPLIIDAIDTKYTDTVIISNESANQIIRENQKNNFLGKFKVSFVVK